MNDKSDLTTALVAATTEKVMRVLRDRGLPGCP